MDNEPFASEKVLVFRLWPCSGPLVLWRGQNFGSGVIGGKNSLLCACFSFVTCSFVLLSLQTTHYLVGKRVRPVWAGSAVVHIHTYTLIVSSEHVASKEKSRAKVIFSKYSVSARYFPFAPLHSLWTLLQEVLLHRWNHQGSHVPDFSGRRSELRRTLGYLFPVLLSLWP